MLTLTDNAADVVKQITDQSTTTDEGGLRISEEATAEETGLAMTPVEGPQAGDALVEDGGARVYLDEAAATVLGDKILDAKVEPDGSVQFGVAQQA